MSKKSKILAGLDHPSDLKEKIMDLSDPLDEANKGANQLREIAELKQTHAQLEQSLSLLHATLEAVIEGIVVVDLTGQISTFNQKFVQMWNIPTSLVEDTQKRLEFITSQLKDPDKFSRRVDELYHHPEAEGYDILELKDGRVFEHHARPQWLGGEVVGRVWSFRDITEQKRTEALLRQNEASMAATQRIAHLGNWDTNIVTGALYWSDETYRIFGLTPQEFSATVEAFFSRVHPDDLGYVLKKVDEAYTGKKPYNVDHRIVRADGKVRFVHQEAEVTFDETGKPVRMLGIIQDVTERKLLEMQIQAASERRKRQVQLSAQVAQAIATIADAEALYQWTVTQINEQFGYYHTQLLHYHPDLNELTLMAGYGERGKQMLAEGGWIREGTALIGLSAATGASILRPDVSTDPAWRGHPLLPDTKGEIAVPIKLGREDAQAQIMALKSFIQRGFDGLVITAIDLTATRAITAKALEKGIPVVAITHDLGADYQTTLVYTVEREMGYMLGRQAGEWAAKHIPSGQTLKLGMFNYHPVPQVKQREEGIIEGIKAIVGDNIEIIGNETAGDALQAWPIAVAWLQAHPDLNMIVSYNDATALGAYQAVIAAGKDDPHTFFVGGIDAAPEALAAIRKGGAYQATVDIQPRAMGVQAIRTIVAAIKGQPYSPAIALNCTPINLTNLDEFLSASRQAEQAEAEGDDIDDLIGLDLGGLKIGFSVLNLSNPFFAAVVAGAEKEAKRLGIELVVNDPKRVLGVLDVQSHVAGLLDVEDQLMLEGIAAQIAAAIESTSLRQGLEDRLRELSALQRLMGQEGWQAFQTTRQQATPGYLYDQRSIKAITLEELRAPENGAPQTNEASIAAKTQVVTKPMTIHGEIIGGLGVRTDPDNPLAPEDQVFLDTIAEQVAEALERARLLEQTQKRAAEMEAVAQVSAVVSTILAADKLLQEVVDLTKEHFGLYHAHIYLLNEAGDSLQLAAGAGEVGRQMVAQGWNISLTQEQSLVAQAARSRQTVVVNNVYQNPNYMPNPLLPRTHAEMAVPIIIGDTVLGVLDVQDEMINRFTDEDVHVQATLATQIAVALHNASLFQQTQDALAEVQQSQKLLQATIDATPDWIFIRDQEHRYRLVNQGYANSLHMTPEDFIGKNDLEIGFPAEIVKGNPEKGIRGFWADDREVMDSGKTKFVESEPAVVNGQPVFLSTIKVPLRDADGQVWGILGFVRDITERELVLKETENLYKASRRLNEARDLSEMVAAVAEAGPVPAIIRASLLEFEYNSLDEVKAMVAVANWHNGQGAPPLPIGFRAERSIFTSVGLFLNPEPIFFDDVQQDERIDPASLALLEKNGVRALAVLPLKVGARPWGVLILDGEEPYHFTEREMQPYIALARQLAVALENKRLLAETQAALAEVEAVQRRYTIQAWEEYQARNTVLSLEEVREGVIPLREKLLPEISRMAQSRVIASGAIETMTINSTNELAPVSQAPGGNDGQLPIITGQDNEVGSNLIIPLTVRGEAIGVLGIQETEPVRRWLPEEIDLVMAVAEQFAQVAETLRLIDESQQRAAREKRVNEIGEKIQAAQSLEEALQIAIKEVGLSLQAPQTSVQLEVKN